MAINEHELGDAIRSILDGAARGRPSGQLGPHPHYLTAYQILRRLPAPLHQALINEYGEPGKNSGRHFTAVSRIAQVARSVADYDFMDGHELSFIYDEGEEPVEGGNRVVGLYRARRPEAKAVP